MIERIADAAASVAALALLVVVCAVLWWVLGATFGLGYLGFKFVTG